MFIPTQRLLLRPSWPEDLDEFVALVNDERVASRLGNVPLPDSPEAARAYIATARPALLPHFFIYLRGKDGLELVGSIGFEHDEHTGLAELGYWIAAQHWGHGYASEAVQAVLAHAWMLGHEAVIATDTGDNPGHARVLEKAGFVAIGKEHERINYQTMRIGKARIYRATPETVTDALASAAASPQLA